MSITRPRKARILDRAGMIYVAGWLTADEAEEVNRMIDATEPQVDKIIEETQARDKRIADASA